MFITYDKGIQKGLGYHEDVKIRQNLTTYRVSTKTVPTFFFWISRLPRGLKIPSQTFFNSPLCIDSKNIHFVIIWSNLDQDIAKILQGSVSGCPLVLMSAQALDSLINKKIQHLNWISCPILAVSQSTFHQIITKWIFLKSLRKSSWKISKIEFLGP